MGKVTPVVYLEKKTKTMTSLERVRCQLRLCNGSTHTNGLPFLAAGTYIDGSYTYNGQWEEDAMHGQGQFNFASGASYDGAWAAGQYNGVGVYKWPDGRAYKVTYDVFKERESLALSLGRKYINLC
jgi:hypothetical protein